jgi:antitoxin component HigA of HigAB toxin-antitoxin module
MADLKEMLKQIRERTTPEQKRYVENNMEIVDYIYDLLAEMKMKPVDLARALDKKPAEISKWLSGTHNLTLQSITKIEVALDADIIMTPAQAKVKFEKIKYVPMAVTAKVNKPGAFVSTSYDHSETSSSGCGIIKIHTQNENRTKQYVH